MSSAQARPLLSPEEIAVRAGQEAQFFRLPVRGEVFAERDIRLRQGAAGNSMRDYLLLMADVVRAQHDVLQTYPTVKLPSAADIDAASRAGMPLLPVEHWPRDPAWREGFTRILDAVLARLPAGPARDSVASLRAADVDVIERQADRLSQNITFGLDFAAAPFIGAALQAYWTHMVIATQELHGKGPIAPFGRIDDATRCPCCGGLPVASVSRIDPGQGGLRYLQCSMCSTQWHMVRIKCTHCQSTKGIHYQSLQLAAAEAPAAATAVVEAETCDECGSYLKIVRMERDPHVEAMADDLATVTLDLLVSEAGYQRHGANYMLLFGDPESPPDTPGSQGDGAGGGG